MSKRHGHGILAILFGMCFELVSWTCDQVIPTAAVEPQAKAAEMCYSYPTPAYDDPVNGGLGECLYVEVWKVQP